MKIEKLGVQKRERTGSSESRRIRRSGGLPLNLYGLDRSPAALTASAHEFNQLFTRGSRMFELRMGELTQVCLLKEVSYNAVGDRILHADFWRIDDTKPVSVRLPIEFVGSPIPVAGAVVDYPNRDILVRCLPREVPSQLTVDVNNLEVGQHIEAKDLVLPAGASLETPPHTTVVSFHYKQVQVEPDPAEAPAELVVLKEKKPDQKKPESK